MFILSFVLGHLQIRVYIAVSVSGRTGTEGPLGLGCTGTVFQCSEYLAVRGFTLKSTCTQLLKFFHFFARSL